MWIAELSITVLKQSPRGQLALILFWVLVCFFAF